MCSAVALALPNAAAWAQSGTGNMQISATLNASCQFDGNVVGQFPAISQHEEVNADWTMIRFRCTQNLPLTVSVNMGQHEDSGERRMMATVGGTPQYLAYQLYTTAARNQPFPVSAAQVGLGFNGPATGEYQDVHFYARIPKPASVPIAGDYEDVIRVTLDW